ncbi:MAG: Stk1 family PASTA domain-containing Ser/Thr kinase [Lachnospiraceae bacterium]|jgi:serine/threonine-protein kinase|nr:Stk1 family PASTA domain-containing Ser/Thr kinase [Lachnospiraceae bacterium]
MIKIGMMIGDRYEILEKIGTGGMSDVYKAKCHKLNRFVAIKVLKQEFSENANFVSKFRTEAQAAAGLMHPNIVNVYDVGEENGIYYFVMEMVEGITLKKYIEKKARLSVKEAISIAIQVSMGIEAAHNNHIIHRDIKPQNIMISKDGKVKVTDFGIAKAATSNTITSNVMGSVHYTSPEQARGGYSDEKSDIYSLGITMFEMLTGRVPFNGETTVAIAIKHIQEELPSPREYVPEIPISVEQIVFKCCQKSPDRRYQSMAELIDDLKQSLLNPDEDFVKVVEPDRRASTRMITDREMERIKRASAEKDNLDESMRLNRANYGNHEDGEDEDYEEDYDPRMEKITTILAIVAAIIIGCIVIVLVGRALGLFHLSGSKDGEDAAQEEQTEQVEMPGVTGMAVKMAQDRLRKLGLEPEVKYVENAAYPQNQVISANVEEGMMVDPGTVITLTVSSGTEGVSVPKATGITFEEAKNTLEKAGFVVNKNESSSSTVENNYVISQNPESGTRAPKGSAVTIVVSTGAEDSKIRVPDLMGKEEDEAVAMLVEAGLPVGTVGQINNEDFPEGQVCYQSYSVGSFVDPGTPIDIKISMGGKAATYTYSGNITGPTREEDPDYNTEGTTVKVTIVTADGTKLLDTQTTSFPVAVNYSGIKSPTGTITFEYTNVKRVETGTAEDGTPTTEEVKEEKKIERTIEFTEER